jgi:hypothetical protein
MLGSLLIATFLLGILAGGVALIAARLSRYPNRSVVDVAEFLRPGNPQKVMDLLNPQFEERLRATLPRREFLRQQRKSLFSILEFLSCMSHSTRICIELANNELEAVQPPGGEDSAEYIECALALQQAAVEFRFYCLATTMKARTWLLFRTQWWLPLEPPRLSELKDMQGLNFAASYNRFVRALANLGRLHGMEFQDSFLHALIKSDPLNDVLRLPQK